MRIMMRLKFFIGSDPKVVGEHNSFADKWLKNEADYELLLPFDSRMRILICTFSVWWFQIRLTVWIRKQKRSKTMVSSPDLKLMFEMIKMGDAWDLMLPIKCDRVLRRQVRGVECQMGGERNQGGKE